MANWEIVMNWKMDGTTALNVLHFADSNPTSIDWQEVVDSIANDFVTAFTDVLVPSITWEGITVREDVPGAIGNTYTPTAGSIAGTSVNDQYARVLAMLVRKNATGSVRPVRGRIYQPGVSSELLDGQGEWTVGARTAVRDFWIDVSQISTVNSGTFTMQIKAGDPTKPNTNPYNPVNTLGAQPVPATQRRRRVGVGI